MRNLREHETKRLVDQELAHYGCNGNESNGMFAFGFLRVIASSGEGWEHVSVSRADRCPTWDDMEYIARLFFKDDEYAFQLHVPIASHINVHPHCLHWWRPTDRAIPLPPTSMV